MKYIVSITLMAFISLSISITLHAEDIIPEKPTLINSYDEDITGDGFKETIELKGILLSNESKYYRDIWVDVKNIQSKKQWKISYGGGYNPTLQLVDISQDKVTDLFIQISTETKGNNYTYHIHSLRKGNIKRITKPEQSHINGDFKDNFSIDLSILYDVKPIVINIEDKQNEYIQIGIYKQNGQLTKPTSVIIDPISRIEPLLISKAKGYGVRTFQQIHGSADHQLGFVETLWYFEIDKWLILRTKWIPL